MSAEAAFELEVHAAGQAVTAAPQPLRVALLAEASRVEVADEATLERHLHIEEELLFPAWLEAGGREAWLRGLKNVHTHLRQHLESFSEPDSRRKFLRLLDGHDEKEERVVYPDILTQLGDKADALLESVMIFPIRVANDRTRQDSTKKEWPQPPP